MSAKTKTREKSATYSIEPAHSGEPAFLSYASLIGLRVPDALSLARKIESGFDFRTFTRLQEAIELTNKQLADLISISSRTLSRRRTERRLRPDESDRLLRLARVFDLTVSLFEGDKQAAQAWLTRPNPALGGKPPLDLSRTEVGAREVENLVFRLEHGVFA